MFSRAQQLVPSNLDDVILRNPLVLPQTMAVLDAIAIMGGLQTPELTSCLSIKESNLPERWSVVLVAHPESHELIGIFTEHDLVRLIAKQVNIADLTLAQVMVSPVIHLKLTELVDLKTVVKILFQLKIRHLPVLNADNSVLGVVTPGSLWASLQLDKHFRNRLASEIMMPVFQTLFLGLSLRDVANEMWETQSNTILAMDRVSPLERLPSVPVGILTESDLLIALAMELNLDRCQLRAVMSYPLFTVTPETNVSEVIEQMLRRSVRRAVVIDDHLKLLGIITPGSVLSSFFHSESLTDEKSPASIDLRHESSVLEPSSLLLHSQSLNSSLPMRLPGQLTHSSLPFPSEDDSSVTSMDNTPDANPAQAKIEAQLWASERRYENLVAAAPVGIFRTDVTGRCIYVNDRWCHISGMASDSALGEGWIKALHPDSVEQVLNAWQESVIHQVPFQLEYCFLQPSGREAWVYGQAVPETNESGETVGYFGTITDISDRKFAETQLQNLISGTAATLGDDFFVALTKYLCEGLDISYALLSELKNDSLSTLAAWGNNAELPHFTYHPENTPCEITLAEGKYYCGSNIQQAFPADHDLVDMSAESYFGIALQDSEGLPLGLVCLINKRPIANPEKLEQLLGVFAARASAELERQRATEALKKLNQELEERVQSRTAELLEREQFLQTVLDTFPLSVFWKDQNSNFQGGNRNFLRDVGLQSGEDLIGKSDSDLPWTEAQVLEHQRSDRGVMDEDKPTLGMIEEQQSPDGKKIWLETNKLPIHDLKGNVVGVLGTYQDITIRKLNEQAIERQLAAIEAAIDGISILQDDTYLFVNQSFARLFDQKTQEDFSGNIWELPYGPIGNEEYHTQILPLLKADKVWQGETTGTRSDGRQFPVGASLTLLPNGLIVCVCQDISERKQSEKHLQSINEELVRATQLKDEFLANMSHELRTPLNAILGMSEALVDEIFGDLNPKQLKALRMIDSSGAHLLDLINDILDVAKIESGQIELDLTPMAIAPLCHDSLSIIAAHAAKKQIKLETKIPRNLPDLSLDERRIRQVLINLLNNAVKFTPEEGCISLRISVHETEGESPWKNPEPFYLRIAVQDTGIGISKEDQAKLFQPFIQIDSALNRQYNGTGLGLALVRQITEMHGGRVSLESVPEQGSCFCVDLPCQWYRPSEVPTKFLEPNQLDVQTRDFSTPLILVAEDNDANANSMSSYLRANDFKVMRAKNGLEAIAITKMHHPDLILMDIQMPKLDGLEAMKMIQDDPLYSSIPIIAITALAMKGDRERCLEAGATEYFSKPIKFKQLLIAINTHLTAVGLKGS